MWTPWKKTDPEKTASPKPAATPPASVKLTPEQEMLRKMMEDQQKLNVKIRGSIKDAKRAQKSTVADSAEIHTRDILRGLFGLTKAAIWVNRNIIMPVARAADPVIGWAARRYIGLAKRFCYTPDKDGDGYEEFSKKRAAGFALATVFAAASLYQVPATIYYGLTHHKETLYLSQAEQPAPHYFTVKGCHELPCTSENSILYQIDDSVFHHLVNVAKHGTWFYPDYVAAAVPTGLSKCEVDAYGTRFKPFMKWWNFYPWLMEVKCQSVSNPAGGPDVAPSALQKSFSDVTEEKIAEDVAAPSSVSKPSFTAAPAPAP